MRLNYPVYPDLVENKGGCLPRDNRAFALWYYYTLAQQLFEKTGGIDLHLKGGTIEEAQFGLLETDKWLDARYDRIARSVALVYGMKDPGEFMLDGLWECVKAQAHQLKLPTPKDEYMRPLRIALIH
jgi:hypothetical protein